MKFSAQELGPDGLLYTIEFEAESRAEAEMLCEQEGWMDLLELVYTIGITDQELHEICDYLWSDETRH